MIKLKSITKTFNANTPTAKTVIRDLDLSVNTGEFITIIGSNGAGKTTLFNLVAGTTLPSSGTIQIDGRDVTSVPEYKRARYIGRLFQDPLKGTASNMSIADNMMITYKKGFKWPKISLNQRMRTKFMEELIVLRMGLENRMQENVSSLSGGQRQALTLLMTVLSHPAICLLDEHTAALDPQNAELVMDLTTRFIDRYQLTTLMITHNMQHAIDYGHRLLMMDDGQIVIDVSGPQKKALTRQKLLSMFAEVRQKAFDNDEVLLSTP